MLMVLLGFVDWILQAPTLYGFGSTVRMSRSIVVTHSTIQHNTPGDDAGMLMTNPRNTDWILYAPKGCGSTALPSRSIGAGCVRQRQSVSHFSHSQFPGTLPLRRRQTRPRPVTAYRLPACLHVCHFCIHYLLLPGRPCADGGCIYLTVLCTHPL